MKGYFDYNATTPIDEELKEKVSQWMDLGDPYSPYDRGRRAAGLMEMARAAFTGTPGLEQYDLVFTSGGTESNRLALEFLYSRSLNAGLTDAFINRNKVLISALDHSSVFDQAKHLRNLGYDVMLIPSNSSGCIELDFVQENAGEDTALVSVTYASGETGVLQPVGEVSRICEDRGIRFHCDAAQAPGKTGVSWYQFRPSTISLSSHKMGGPPGAGALLYRKGVAPTATFFGEHDPLRPGMLNLPGLLGMAEAWRRVQQELGRSLASLRTLRAMFEKELQDRIPGVRILGMNSERLANTSAVVVPGVSAERMVRKLDECGFQVGSLAGSPGDPGPRVVLEMGIDPSLAPCSIRISMGYLTTSREISELLDSIVSIARGD
ncbi:MAG: aminotransferase class V-fold PLP-dependent enzyme [Leptospiraceae bacterium]|nr:aminotransferase class V-fold PLP-dependent enzyme [Leptospiraceae bacterium]MCB1304311.1 aminotransferase class V-fold PLP-dependent enzyme [Leptospiraceae bacterium]